ncbi:hypothetical protein D1007_55712 [Hordeum vulgare]|nr:hypothetical protein D1007_55712 [Hordeum vulgare]
MLRLRLQLQSFPHVLSYFTIYNVVLMYVHLLYALQDRWDLEDTPDTEAKERSQKNTDSRKKQKTKRRTGSKSYWQVSFEKRNPETGEEPDCITLWELTHTKNGTWSNTESHDVYDKACEEPHGYGYMAKPSTGSERIRIQIEEQAHATAAFQQRNSELSHQVNDLQDQLQAERANTQEIINLERAKREQLEGKLKEERAERERLLEAERTSRLKFEKKT